MTDQTSQEQKEKKEAKPKQAPMAIGALNQLVIKIDQLEIHIQIDLGAERNQNDTMTLYQEEGNYEHTIKLADLTEFKEDWVNLEFPFPPKDGHYTLIHDLCEDGDDEGEFKFAVFDSVPYEELPQTTLVAEAPKMGEQEESETEAHPNNEAQADNVEHPAV